MKQSLKVLIAVAVNLGLRLIPFRPANVEPIMGTMLPFAKGYGSLTSAVFAFSSMALLDIVQGRFGIWTYGTAGTYAVLALAAGWYFKRRDFSRANSVGFAIVATLVFDAVTGLTFGPLFHDQSFMQALMGQIPFTIQHLTGNILFSALVSPLIYTYFVNNPAFDLEVPALTKKQPVA